MSDNIKGKYKREITLEHDEIPAKINVVTGEMTPIKAYRNNVLEGSHIFAPHTFYHKRFPNGWKFLERYLTSEELIVAITLGDMAKASTNSLKPLSDDTTTNELAEILTISRNYVKDVLHKLFVLGVYGKFEIYEPDVPYTKHWIFNPYLLFAGVTIKNEIAILFKNTHCAKAFSDKDYFLTPEHIIEFKIKNSTKKRRVTPEELTVKRKKKRLKARKD